MGFMQSFQMAIKNILASKMRSILTMLGIIIGVGAVIVIVGLGNGMEIFMTDSFKSMGTNLLTVQLFGRNSTRTATVDDMFEILDANPQLLEGVSPNISVNGTVKIGNDTASNTAVTGVSETYNHMRSYDIYSGRFLQYIDVSRRLNVCVIGSYLHKEWFLEDSLGKTLKINGIPFTIVGVMAEQAESAKGDADDAVYIPYSVASKMGNGRISSYYFTVVSEDTVAQSKQAISDSLAKIYGSTDAFFILSMSEILGVMSQMLNMVITVLAAIAAISLVVGGIGIMNIMLVSVSERTREIGIRKALGAKQKTIMQQFVIEAATTSAIGGTIGIGFGYLLSSIGTQIITVVSGTEMVVSPSTTAVLGSFAISAFIGIVFGYLPAKKAARLNPIDALRYE